MLTLFVATNLAEAQTQTRSDSSLRPIPDSARTSGSLYFKRTLPFETEFLTRVAEMALERARSAARPENAAAQTYAQRYGISRDLAHRIISVARAEGIDPELAFRLVRVESRFVTRAHGPSGSLGLTQLMPSTARSIDRTVNTEAEILDPQTNLRLGFRYLRSMIDKYKGDVRLGILAYNRGPVAVDRAIRSGRDPENGYSHLVFGTKSQNPYRGRGVAQK
ncbi:MAG: transglycosylase SLT domain-containing protein [Gemmatimonadetes bacterium]|nr:transglycosylase SLT domain-containing protein [Gemmatimonadota bacterium]